MSRHDVDQGLGRRREAIAMNGSGRPGHAATAYRASFHSLSRPRTRLRPRFSAAIGVASSSRAVNAMSPHADGNHLLGGGEVAGSQGGPPLTLTSPSCFGCGAAALSMPLRNGTVRAGCRWRGPLPTIGLPGATEKSVTPMHGSFVHLPAKAQWKEREPHAMFRPSALLVGLGLSFCAAGFALGWGNYMGKQPSAEIEDMGHQTMIVCPDQTSFVPTARVPWSGRMTS